MERVRARCAANGMFLDTDSLSPALYIIDPLDESIYEFTLAGTFKHRFKSSDPNAFRALTAVTVYKDNVYAASGSVLYTFSLSDLVSATPTP